MYKRLFVSIVCRNEGDPEVLVLLRLFPNPASGIQESNKYQKVLDKHT